MYFLHHDVQLLVRLFHFILLLDHLLNGPSVYTRITFFSCIIYAYIIPHIELPAICFTFYFPCMLSCFIICISLELILK